MPTEPTRQCAHRLGCPACHASPNLFTTLAQVDYPKCGDRVADNTTWFKIVDGRVCMCDKGTLLCKKVRRAGAAASNHPLYYPCSSLFFALYPLTSDCPPHPPLCRPPPAATS